MSYPGRRPTPPRSILVIVGGLIAWAGLIAGVLITTPEYHRALTMKAEPVEMTWQKLVEQGLTDNSYVRLVGVELDQDNPMTAFENMLAPFEQLDPNASPEEQQAVFEQFASDNVTFAAFADTVMQPIKVVPQGIDPEQIPARIVVPQNAWATEAAYREIESTGTLTGRFTPGRGESLELQVTKLLLANSQAAIEPVVANAVGSDESVAEPTEQQLHDEGQSDVQWVFEPVESVPNVSEAQQWFWVSGLAVAVGMVICGAGGPSITCCVLCQGPSILSLFGYPLRYGRGGKTTRLVYTALGLGLLGVGYQKMIVEGRFGQLEGDLALSVMGFVAGSLGAAALLGAGTNSLAHRLNVSLDPKSTKEFEEPKMSLTDACSLEPTEQDLGQRYVDPELAHREDALRSDTLNEAARTLTGLGFDEPEPLVWMDGESMLPTIIQLGCQEMVVADVESVNGEPHVRLVSVLQDGIAIITLPPNFPSQKSTRFGSSGFYSIRETDDLVEMLSAHLEQTVGMAERRNTSVVAIETDEVADAVLYGRRVLTDIRAQYGEEIAEVGASRYGRFRFPIAEVPQVVTA